MKLVKSEIDDEVFDRLYDLVYNNLESHLFHDTQSKIWYKITRSEVGLVLSFAYVHTCQETAIYR